MSATIKGIFIFITVFLLSVSGSFALTTYLYTPDSATSSTTIANPTAGGGLNIDPSAPKTSECPLNGEMYTSAEEKVWSARRPLFVMIENSTDARPQSGLSSADVIYEAITEGGITRFGAIFYCATAAKDTIVGPVRSARTTFVNLASEYNYPLYTHVGGANCSSADEGKTCTSDKRVQALEQINQYGWGGSKGNDLNQFSIGFPTFWRDYERLGHTVATEHTMYSSTDKLYKYASGRGWTNKTPDGKTEWKTKFVPWTFVDGATSVSRGSVTSVSYGFWENYHDMDVTWHYNSTDNTYTRDNGGSAHTDLNNKETITVSNVVVQFTKELGPLDEHKHMLYEVVGTGKGLLFQNGKAVEITWSKKDRESRTVFMDKLGKKISFVRGPIWISVLPSDNTIQY